MGYAKRSARRRAGEDSGQATNALGRKGRFHFGSEELEMVEGHHAEEGLEHNLRFRQACFEIVMQAVEHLPAIRPNGDSARDLVRRGRELDLDLRNRVRQDTELVKKSGPLAKQDVMKHGVPRSRVFADLTAEEVDTHRFDGRHIVQPTTAADQSFTAVNDCAGKTVQKVNGYANLLVGAYKLAACAQGDGIAERHAEHGIRTFPTAHNGVENPALVTR
ncbi:MAG TPA: hypothetical protein VMF66_13765 [Candidatus Acidoferrum sp.]|nr:hypothetical protein [Candidatus Acidoferrum sp.]